MKNKKLLNIFILLLSLVTLVAEILLFAFPAYNAETHKLLVVIFWILNTFAMISLVATIIVTLISLFMDDYVCSKMVETFALISFIMVLANLIIFSMSRYTLSFGYIAVCILAFLNATISQILRLIAAIPTWKTSFKELVKTHKPITIINALSPKDDDVIMADNGKLEQSKEYDESTNIERNEVEE